MQIKNGSPFHMAGSPSPRGRLAFSMRQARSEPALEVPGRLRLRGLVAVYDWVDCVVDYQHMIEVPGRLRLRGRLSVYA